MPGAKKIIAFLLTLDAYNGFDQNSDAGHHDRPIAPIVASVELPDLGSDEEQEAGDVLLTVDRSEQPL